MRRTNRADREAQIARWMQELEGHRVSERPSISWHLNATREEWAWAREGSREKTVRKVERYQSSYAYAVTWTPGTLTLSGDLGEWTLTHWYATPSVAAAIRWVQGGDFYYLMSKSSAKEEYDPVATAAFIIEMANENTSPRDLLREERRYRKAKLDSLCEWDAEETRWAVDATRGEEWDRPKLDEFLPDPDSYDLWRALKCRTVQQFNMRLFRDETRHEAPDGWELWLALYERYDTNVDDRGLGRDCIFHAWARRQIRDELRIDLLDRGAERAVVDVIQALEIDDYYGTYRYNDHCYLWYAAIKTWAAKVAPQYPTTTEKETA